MRNCPFMGCTARFQDHLFACPAHWHTLTDDEKQTIHTAFHDYKADSISLEQLRDIQQRVVNEATERIKAAVPERKIVKCRSCGKPMFWATSEASGKTIPMDPEPCRDGNMYERNGEMAAVSLTNQPPPGAILYKSHFATCQNARSHRRPR